MSLYWKWHREIIQGHTEMVVVALSKSLGVFSLTCVEAESIPLALSLTLPNLPFVAVQFKCSLCQAGHFLDLLHS